jgi:hypothetical protein
MLSDKQVKALLQVPEIVPPKRRNHTRGDIQTPAQIANRNRIRMNIHTSLYGGNPYTYNPKKGGNNAK